MRATGGKISVKWVKAFFYRLFGCRYYIFNIFACITLMTPKTRNEREND